MEILAQLKEFGVDVNALNAELQKILQRGVELKYSLDGDSLRIYVDKALCDPIVKLFFRHFLKLMSFLSSWFRRIMKPPGK